MKGRKSPKLWTSTVLAVILSLAVPWAAFAAVWTDQPDYIPITVVTISCDDSDGAGCLADETVQVDVYGPNGYYAACGALADDSGAWSCQVTLWDSDLAIGEYTYYATGQIAADTGTFTDAPKPDCNLTASITSLSNGAVFTAASVGGSASVPFAWTTSGDYTYAVEVKVDGSVFGDANSGSVTLALGVGSHTFQVKADVPGNPAPCQNPNRVANATITIVNPSLPSDTTPPEISYVLTPASPDGSNGWYKSNVTLVWTVTDSESAVTKTGCVDQSITANQAAITYSCSATSEGGSAGPASVTIQRDATAPYNVTVTPNREPDFSGWYNHSIDFAVGGSDVTSGVASCNSPGYNGLIVPLPKS